jgi:hypothetical protein
VTSLLGHCLAWHGVAGLWLPLFLQVPYQSVISVWEFCTRSASDAVLSALVASALLAGIVLVKHGLDTSAYDQ